MCMCHCGEDPDHGILSGLLKACPHRSIALIPNSIKGHVVSGKIVLILCEPPGVVCEIGKQKESHNGD